MLKYLVMSVAVTFVGGCKGCQEPPDVAEDALSDSQGFLERLEREDRPSWAMRDLADSEVEEEPDPTIDRDVFEQPPAHAVPRAWEDESEIDTPAEEPLPYIRDDVDDDGVEEVPAEQKEQTEEYADEELVEPPAEDELEEQALEDNPEDYYAEDPTEPADDPDDDPDDDPYDEY
jgi:hypothetical protein